MTRPGLDIDALHVRVDTLARSMDPTPFDAAPWTISVNNGVEPLVEIGVIQLLRPAANPRPAAASLFGEHVADCVYEVGTNTRTGSGDLILATASCFESQPDEDTLTAYGILRAMCVLRAAAVHTPWSVLDDGVINRLGATHWAQGSTVFIEDALAEHEHLLDLLCGDHRGLRLVRGA